MASGGAGEGGRAGAGGPGGVGGLGGAGDGGQPTPGGSGGGAAGGGAGGSAGVGKAGRGGAGVAGSGGTGGVVECPSVAEMFPAGTNVGSLDGRLVTLPCEGQSTTDDDRCVQAAWVTNGVTTPCGVITPGGFSTVFRQDFAVGGTPNSTYDVTMHFYGILEPKNYGGTARGVTREAGDVRPMNEDTGADPAPWAFATSTPTAMRSDYLHVEIRVYDHNMFARNTYYVNSDTTEGRWTYVIDYARTLPVYGGGKIQMFMENRNCTQNKNCNTGTAPCAGKTRNVDVSAALPAPMGLVQPGLGNDSENAGQWLLVDVTGVACR
jgi:hypothetical protein